MLVKIGVTVGLLFLVAGCVTPPQTAQLIASPPNIPLKYEIADVPFYPQQAYFCGPATLAEVFNYYGLQQTQEILASEIFIPDLEGSLQIEMIAASRQQGLLAYAEEGQLEQVFSLVSQDIPVIVLQNLALSWYPLWHYALVIGYDLENQQVIVHSGKIKRRLVDFEVFERTWQRGKYWFLAAVPPSVTSPHFNRFIFSRSAQDLLSVGQVSSAITALSNATLQWPDYWLPYFLLGNHFLNSDLNLAIDWYQKGLHLASEQAAYLNNYAFALNAAGCQELAKLTISMALTLSPKDTNLIDTQKEILAGQKTGECPIKNLARQSDGSAQ